MAVARPIVETTPDGRYTFVIAPYGMVVLREVLSDGSELLTVLPGDAALRLANMLTRHHNLIKRRAAAHRW